MCRGDVFSGAELRELSGNPMLSPMLQRVVFAGEGILGYPVDQGRGLRDHARKIEPIKSAESVYPTALLVAELLQVDEKTVLRWSLEDASMPVLRLSSHSHGPPTDSNPAYIRHLALLI